MKQFWYIWVMLTALLFSCASNDVVSNQWIQKRKYRDGFYVAHKASKHQPATSHRKEGVCTLETINAEPLIDSARTARQLGQEEHLAHAFKPVKNTEQKTVETGKAQRIPRVLKRIPFSTAGEKVHAALKRSIGGTDSDWSILAFIGIGLATLALLMVLIGTVFFEGSPLLLLFFILAILMAIAGLLLSIFGIQETVQDGKRGKALAIVGTAVNGAIAVAGIFLFVVLIALIVALASA